MRSLVKPVLFLAVLVGVPLGLYLLVPKSGRADHLAGARAAIDRRDFATARRELDEHLARNPRDADAEFLAARTARRAGDGPAAEPHLKRYLELGGDPETAELEREMQRSQDGNVSGAAGVLKFCADHPDHPAAPFMLEAMAQGLLKAGDLVRAVACLDLWLARDLTPADRVQGLVWRGQALERQGRAPEAAADYGYALAIDEGHVEARLHLAEFLIRDEPRKALALFERLEREAPGRPEVLFGLARCRRQLGDLDAAAQLLARLLANHPDDVAMLTEAGIVALDRGRPAEAEPLLRKAVKLAPDRREPNLQLARCLHDLGKADEEREQQARLKQIDDELKRRLDAATRKP
jgi:tetratricopeptide (TPR) repeat protein